MSNKLDYDIKKGELEARHIGQQHAKMVAQNEILKLQKRQDELQITIESLDIEIDKTKTEINNLIPTQK